MRYFAALLVSGVLSTALTACEYSEPPKTLPRAITNNAVALYDDEYSVAVAYSFYGLETGKTWEDISTDAFECVFVRQSESAETTCKQIPSPPVSQGRLASIAVSIYPYVYIIGGYTVGEDGSEVSTPEVFEYNRGTSTYRRLLDMPTPVDDMVAFTYLDRYIYLISGWHNTGNVNLVQVFDTQENRWFQATDYPGTAVFGHAGGVVNGQIIIADGVAVTGKTPDGRREFGLINEAWQGIIDAEDPAKINWTPVPPHPDSALYRMAATGDDKRNRIIFSGGGDNAYNYNGIGYNGIPATPSDKVFAYDFDENAWSTLGTLKNPTMDHRGLLQFVDHFYTLGGMDVDQKVISDITLVHDAKNG